MGGEFSGREEAAYVRKGNWWITRVLQGTHQGLWVHQVQGTWEHLLAVHVPGGWCPAGQQIACLRGAKLEW